MSWRRSSATSREVHAYALDLANRIAAREPAKYTTEAGPSRRIGKLFIDHLRNGRGFTAVGAYSPRARKGLPMAMPTTWDSFAAGAAPTPPPPHDCARLESWSSNDQWQRGHA
jgi:bifunctional non-homologous end joining protein LigD